jgi:hypothetical protein
METPIRLAMAAMVPSAIRIDSDSDPSPWSLTTRTIAVMAKPLSCRFRLHKWEDRENPETEEHYKVCVRCNAYRDRGTSPWGGSGGAWGIGAGG